MLVIVGVGLVTCVIMKINWFETPPPGCGVWTSIVTLPGVATNDEEMLAVSSLPL